MGNIVKIDYKGLRNTRDLGQFKTVEGRQMKTGVIYRSGRIDKMSKKRIKRFLEEYNIKTIIDLRTQVEVSESKNFLYPQYVDYFHIPVLNQQFFGITHEINKMSKAMMEQRKKLTENYSPENYMVEMYQSIVFEPSSQRHFATIFEVFATQQEGAILYHCTSGKDRTGITSLFLLTLLGVSEEDILEDYEISNEFNMKYIKNRTMLMNIFMPTSKRFKRLMIAMLYTKREYLEETINAIKAEYGSVLNFMYEKLDITKEKHEKIKNLFLI